MRILGRRKIEQKSCATIYEYQTDEGVFRHAELAERLGINRRTLTQKIKEHGLLSPEVTRQKGNPGYAGNLEIYEKVLVPRPKYRPLVKWDTNHGLMTTDEVCTILGIRKKTFWKRLHKHGFHSRAATARMDERPKNDDYLDDPNEEYLQLSDEDRGYMLPLVGTGLLDRWKRERPTEPDEYAVTAWVIEQQWKMEEDMPDMEPIWEIYPIWRLKVPPRNDRVYEGVGQG